MRIEKERVLVESGKDVSDGTDNATEQAYNYHPSNGDVNLCYAIATYIKPIEGLTTQADLAKHLASVLAEITKAYDGVEFVATVWREEEY